jgi:hypothetical protein
MILYRKENGKADKCDNCECVRYCEIYRCKFCESKACIYCMVERTKEEIIGSFVSKE